MKRLTLILFAALCIAANLSAQNKPGKGSFGTEVQFNPFDQNGETFKLDGLTLQIKKKVKHRQITLRPNLNIMWETSVWMQVTNVISISAKE